MINHGCVLHGDEFMYCRKCAIGSKRAVDKGIIVNHPAYLPLSKILAKMNGGGESIADLTSSLTIIKELMDQGLKISFTEKDTRTSG